jgi:hypothetical protein
MNKNMTTLQFSNRPPLQFVREKIEIVYDAGNEWGHSRICGYRGDKNLHVWSSYNSGRSYGGSYPDTTRRHLIGATEAEVRAWAGGLQMTEPDETQDGWTQEHLDAVRAWIGIEVEVA